jgi:hypothetical protein
MKIGLWYSLCSYESMRSSIINDYENCQVVAILGEHSKNIYKDILDNSGYNRIWNFIG